MVGRVDSRARVECVWFRFASDTMSLNRETCATLFCEEGLNREGGGGGR